MTTTVDKKYVGSTFSLANVYYRESIRLAKKIEEIKDNAKKAKKLKKLEDRKERVDAILAIVDDELAKLSLEEVAEEETIEEDVDDEDIEEVAENDEEEIDRGYDIIMSMIEDSATSEEDLARLKNIMDAVVEIVYDEEAEDEEVEEETEADADAEEEETEKKEIPTVILNGESTKAVKKDNPLDQLNEIEQNVPFHYMNNTDTVKKVVTAYNKVHKNRSMFTKNFKTITKMSFHNSGDGMYVSDDSAYCYVMENNQIQFFMIDLDLKLRPSLTGKICYSLITEAGINIIEDEMIDVEYDGEVLTGGFFTTADGEEHFVGIDERDEGVISLVIVDASKDDLTGEDDD